MAKGWRGGRVSACGVAEAVSKVGGSTCGAAELGRRCQRDGGVGLRRYGGDAKWKGGVGLRSCRDDVKGRGLGLRSCGSDVKGRVCVWCACEAAKAM